jgi:hypothetical protein
MTYQEPLPFRRGEAHRLPKSREHLSMGSRQVKARDIKMARWANDIRELL